MTDVALGGVVVERTDEQSAIVSVEVEFEVPGTDMTEEETAEHMARITALEKLWGTFRLQGWSVKELIETIEH